MAKRPRSIRTGLKAYASSQRKSIFNLYMVRNHQDGYPYLNLHLFYFLKYTETSFFFGKIDLSMNSRPKWERITRDKKKMIFIFKTGQTGQTPKSLTNQFYKKKLCFFIFSTRKKNSFSGLFSTFQFFTFFCLKIYRNINFFW